MSCSTYVPGMPTVVYVTVFHESGRSKMAGIGMLKGAAVFPLAQIQTYT